MMAPVGTRLDKRRSQGRVPHKVRAVGPVSKGDAGMMTGLGVCLVVCVALFAMHVAYWQPRLRRRRLKELRPSLERVWSQALPPAQPVPEQQALREALQAIEVAAGRARDAEVRARARRIPIPPPVLDGHDRETILRQAAAFLDKDATVLAAAGAEQFARSLFDVLTPDAFQHFGVAARILLDAHWDDVLQEAVEHGFAGVTAVVAANALGEGLTHMSVAAAAAAPGEMVAAVGHAGAEAAGGFDLSDASGAHFPWITLALSTVRELRLLNDGKTEVERSLKNVALDTGGTAVGALAGAKAGALVGSFFGPIGTTVGAVLGGIGGAIGGRQITNAVKRKPLENACAHHNASYERMQKDITDSARTLAGKVREEAVRAQGEYEASVPAAPTPAAAVSERPGIRDAAGVLAARSRDAVRDRIQHVSQTAETVLQEIRPCMWYERLLGLDTTTSAQRGVRRTCARATRRLQRELGQLPEDGWAREDPLAALRALAQASVYALAPAAYGVAEAETRGLLHAHLAQAAAWASHVAVRYARGVASVASVLRSEAERDKRLFDERAADVRRAAELVLREKCALGLS